MREFIQYSNGMGQSNVSFSLLLSGAVQGVGLRPRLKRWADEFAIAGWVRNDGDQVRAHIQGESAAITAFLAALRNRLAAVVCEPQPAPWQDCHGFVIVPSAVQPVSSLWQVPADRGICAQCCDEFHDPSNRRYQYPLISCHDCGPRFSILHRMPFARAHTAYHGWQPCERCQAEFADPASRRFHSELISCPDCGPRLQLWNGRETLTGTSDSLLAQAVDCLRDGGILVLKSQTAVQLLCRADAADVVLRLRERKQRPRKPLALLVASVAQARALAVFDADEQGLLESPARPIVLVRKCEYGSIRVAPNVAPDVPDWGLLLPVSGLHLALLQQLGAPLVCTSANRSGEPVLFDNSDVMAAGNLYDLALLHDMTIHIPQDDSLAMCTLGRAQLLRRARGYAHAIFDMAPTGPVMALGGDLKHAVALARNGRALLGPYVGDLDTAAVQQRQADLTGRLQALHALVPEQVCCDAHPGYHSRQQALTQAAVPLLVPHHLAHVYTNHLVCPLPDRYLALAWDGAGWGQDGTLWGSEAFLVDQQRVRRVATLAPFSLPGADQAARQPWRMALALCWHAGLMDTAECTVALSPAVSDVQRNTVTRMLARDINNPQTHSMGRLFDAVSHVLCGGIQQAYEGEAALQLQALASQAEPSQYPFVIPSVEREAILQGDWRPAWRTLLQHKGQGVAPAALALGFHRGLVDWALALVHYFGVSALSVSGGCFQNRLLQSLLLQQADALGIQVFWPATVPLNDGGIALGQLAYAATQTDRNS